MTPEEWKPVVGWEGLYEVSSHGRVRSLDRVVVRSNGHPQTVKGCLLGQSERRSGHKSLHLSRGGKARGYLVHRLVAEAFSGTPPVGKFYVLHSNGVPGDNQASNLRWGDQKDNMADAVRHGTSDCWGHKKNPKPDCPQGHPYSGDNLYMDPRGRRVCRSCKREWARQKYNYKEFRV